MGGDWDLDLDSITIISNLLKSLKKDFGKRETL